MAGDKGGARVLRWRVVRIGGLLAAGASLVVPLTSAFACNPTATLALSPTAAAPGTRVAGTGKYFTPAPSAEPVVVRFNSRTGPVLWTGGPDTAGNISFTFTVPDASPDAYIIIASQNAASGEPAAGTPGRAAFQVLAPPPPPPTTTTQPPTTTTTEPPPVPPEVGTEQAQQAPPAGTSPPPAAPASTAPAAAAVIGAGATGSPGKAATAKAGTGPVVVTRSSATTSTSAAPPTTGTAEPSTTVPTAPPTSVAPTTAPGDRPIDLAAQQVGSGTRDTSSRTPLVLGLVLLATLAASARGVRRRRPPPPTW